MSVNPGARLRHYDVTALIGEGGMGQVWQATDTQNARRGLSHAWPRLKQLWRSVGSGSGNYVNKGVLSEIIVPPAGRGC